MFCIGHCEFKCNLTESCSHCPYRSCRSRSYAGGAVAPIVRKAMSSVLCAQKQMLRFNSSICKSNPPIAISPAGGAGVLLCFLQPTCYASQDIADSVRSLLIDDMASPSPPEYSDVTQPFLGLDATAQLRQERCNPECPSPLLTSISGIITLNRQEQLTFLL